MRQAMALRATCLVLLGGVAEGLLPAVLPSRAPCRAQRAADPLMMPDAAALAKKSADVVAIKQDLEESALVFCVRTEGLKVNELNNLRMELPEDIKMRCVKNTLMQRATEDYPQFQAEKLPELLHYSNYWFFVPEDKLRESVELWGDWTEKYKKKSEIIGGVFDAEVLDADGIEAVSKLPTKQELMGTTAVLLKAMPQKLARLLKEASGQKLARGVQEARGTKMARAVKLASAKLE